MHPRVDSWSPEGSTAYADQRGGIDGSWAHGWDEKSPESVGLAAAGETGRIKGSLTADGEARTTNHDIPPLADLHKNMSFLGKKARI